MKKAKKTNEFSEGENIIFRLEIKNSSDDDVVLAHTNIADILGYNAFRVYTIDGKDMGTPWDAFIDDFLGAFSSFCSPDTRCRMSMDEHFGVDRHQ